MSFNRKREQTLLEVPILGFRSLIKWPSRDRLFRAVRTTATSASIWINYVYMLQTMTWLFKKCTKDECIEVQHSKECVYEEAWQNQARGTPSKNGSLSLIYAYLISCFWLSISTTRKAMWKWNPLHHVLLLLVSKHRYSFEPDNLISLRGYILSKVHIL